MIVLEAFETEFRSRQAKRKRRTRRHTSFSGSDSSDTETEVPPILPAVFVPLLDESLLNLVNDSALIPPQIAELSPLSEDEDIDGSSYVYAHRRSDDNEPIHFTRTCQTETCAPVEEEHRSSAPAQVTTPPHHEMPTNPDQQKTAPTTPSERGSPSQIFVPTPEIGWIVNKQNYFSKVAPLIKYGLANYVSKPDVHSFLERLRKAEQKKTKADQDFWTTPDPWIDAWMNRTKPRTI